jgi:hypothetical protein
MNKYFEDYYKEFVGKTLFEFGNRFDELINFTLTEGNLKGLEDYCIRSGEDFKTKLNGLFTITVRYVSNPFFEYECIVPGFISPYDIKENTKTYKLWKKLSYE